MHAPRSGTWTENNKLVKDSGGAVGLTGNPNAFRHWMVAGPEQARLLKEFESQVSSYSDEEGSLHHHEQSPSVQELFKKHVCDLSATISSMWNPFLDDCPEIVLNTRYCASEEVVRTVRSIKALGLSQYKEYADSVIVARDTSIHQPTKKIFLALLKGLHQRRLKPEGRYPALKVIVIYLVICILRAPLEVVILRNFFPMKITHGHHHHFWSWQIVTAHQEIWSPSFY